VIRGKYGKTVARPCQPGMARSDPPSVAGSRAGDAGVLASQQTCIRSFAVAKGDVKSTSPPWF